MLAIVIPYYKFTFFEATLESLAGQTDQRFKVYIGDDASLERPSGLLEKYQGKFDFEYHRFEENLGEISLTQQWERCISLSGNEEWIMILGDDDVLGENMVESFYGNLSEIEKNKINVVRFSTQKLDENNVVISGVYRQSKLEKAAVFLFDKKRSSLSEYVFRKSQVLEIGFKNFPLAWYSDVLAVLEFSNFQYLFSVNNAIIYIRISEKSISGSQDNLKLKASAKFYFYYYLLAEKRQYFFGIEKKELYCRINKCYINNKKEPVFLLKITKLYLSEFLLKELFQFYCSIFLASIKKR